MKRLILIVFAALCIGSAQAQQPQQMSWSDRAVAGSIAFAKNLWQRVEKEGRPLADRLLKSAPSYYKGANAQLQALIKRVDQADIPKTFSEKQRMALEIWKIRGAIDVMALSDPEVLKSLLNYQPSTVQKTFSRPRRSLKSQT
jgi:hypothetical protein